MELIDEHGNLFGAVNVIDVLVVLMTVGVVVAGAAVLVPDSEPETATRYVTLDLGSQPSSVADRITEGDTMTAGSDELTITDVYVAPGVDGSAAVTVRARVSATVTQNGPIGFGDGVVSGGRTLTIQTGEYDVEGTILTVDGDGASLDVEETTVTLRTTVASAAVPHIDEDDVFEIGGQEAARVDHIRVFPTENSTENRVLVEVSLRTLRQGDRVTFGTFPVTIGTTLPFRTDAYDLTGTVIERDGLGAAGTDETVTAVVTLENVDPALADAVDVGDEERFADETYARVTDKQVEPAAVVLTSDDGNIYERDHPRNKDVYLTVELSVRSTPTWLWFHGERLTEGSTVVLDFGTVVVHGTVTDLEDP